MNLKNILLSLGVFSFTVLISAGSAVAQTSPRYTQNIYFGLKNSQVTQLQQDLAKDTTVYPEKLVTGYFGSLTLRAVKNFQSKYGIQQTGYVGPLTRGKLNELYGMIVSQNKWGCRVVTQGTEPDPNNPPPTVCGYIPICPPQQTLIASLGQGTWPDGSLKGTFSCSLLPPA